MPGRLDGEHTFELEPLAEDRTRFIQSERFNGVLVGLLSRTLDKQGESGPRAAALRKYGCQPHQGERDGGGG